MGVEAWAPITCPRLVTRFQPARACAQHSPTNKSDPVGKKKVRKNHPDQQAVKTNDDFDMTGDQSVHQSHPSVDTASYDKGN